jgi:hypothetical protein
MSTIVSSDDDATAAHATGEANASEKQIPPAPDGGLQAWLQVLAAHLVLINTWVRDSGDSSGGLELTVYSRVT